MGEPFTGSACRINGTLLVVRGSARFSGETAAYDASDTFAYGLTNQQTTSTVRQPGANLPTSTTDSLGRMTSYTYDALGNVASITRLAGTPQAVTTTFTYDTTYSQVTSVRV